MGPLLVGDLHHEDGNGADALSLLLSTSVLFTELPAQEELPPLPGPALDLPVDVDGDGVPTFGDVFVFNHWLALGGDLETALAKAQTNGQLIDLTQFFSSSASALSPDAAILGLGGGSESPDAPLVASPDGHIDFTRRIPQNPVPNQTSNHARITPDGKVIVFSSLANLDGSGNNTKFQVFRITLDAGGVGDAVTSDLCSKTTGGAKATQHCLHPSVSDDGKVVVFDTVQALNTILDQNNFADVYVRDFRGGSPTTVLLSKAVSNGLAGNGNSNLPCIFPDGNVVAFTSTATNLTTNTVSGLGDVFRVGSNGSTPQMLLVSRSDLTTEPLANAPMRTTDPNLDSVGRILNSTGNLIIFQGAPSNWTFSHLAGNNVEQIFVRNTSTARTFLLSGTASDRGDGMSRRGCISADGTRAAFSSKSTIFDLTGLSETIEDVFFLTLASNGTPVLPPTEVHAFGSNPPNSIGGNDESFEPMLDATGQHLVFASCATNLTDPNGNDPDTNGLRDIYLRHLENPDPPSQINQRLNENCHDQEATGGASFDPDVALGGRVSTYQSAATNLVHTDQDQLLESDNNAFQDIFESGLRPNFMRGDVNQDGVIQQLDGTLISDWLFLGGQRPRCVDAADVDDSGVVDTTDSTTIYNFLYQGGQPPAAPFPGCGFDPTDDCLTCKVRAPNCPEGHP